MSRISVLRSPGKGGLSNAADLGASEKRRKRKLLWSVTSLHRPRLSCLSKVLFCIGCALYLFCSLSISGQLAYFPTANSQMEEGDRLLSLGGVEDLVSLAPHIANRIAVHTKFGMTNRNSTGILRPKKHASMGVVTERERVNLVGKNDPVATTEVGGTSIARGDAPSLLGPIQMEVQYYELWNHTTNTIEIPDEHRYFGKDKRTSLEILQQILHEKRDRVGNMTITAGIGTPPECFVPNTAKTRALADDVLNGRMKLPKGPVLYVGLPKTGTSTMREFFNCSGFAASHHQQGKYMMTVALKKNRWPLRSNLWNRQNRKKRRQAEATRASKSNAVGGTDMTNADDDEINDDPMVRIAHLQLDYSTDEGYYPQIQLLDELHQEEPNSIFILAFRPIDDWIRSARKHHGMVRRWGLFDMPGLILTEEQRSRRSKENATLRERSVKLSDEQLRNWWCGHVHHIREYVKEYPSHLLIELDLYDKRGTSSVLADLFQSNSSCWGHANKNNELETWK